MKSNQFLPTREPEEVLGETPHQQEAFQQWKDYLFLNDISQLKELSSTQKEFLVSLSQRYDGAWKEDVLTKVAQEFFEFYEEKERAEGIKIQALDLDGLEIGNWQMLFEDNTEDPLVHVYFKGWEIDYLTITG